MSVRILRGDCRDVLRTLPEESVHCVVTSPPYWGLRDYGVAGQLGLEATPDEYIEKMVAVFTEVRRVLRDDGTLWLNMGDSYAGSGRGGHVSDTSKLQGSIEHEQEARKARGSQLVPGLHAAAAGAGAIGRAWVPAPTGLKQKDLVGIPWMLAFALRAPTYTGRIKRETDRAWMAALIDGEGCITILESSSPHGSGSSYPPILQVRMCDRECIDKAMQLVGSESDNPAQYPPSMEGQRPAFQWRIHGRKAADTIAEIYPFLLIKRKQAIVAWNHQAVRDGYTTKRGVKIPGDALAKQIACREMIQRLNRRESVDIPDWMIEPPQPVGSGWYLRQDVIWSKPNPMPESVTDRCTKAHEYIFLLSKSKRYYFDAAAIKEPVTGGSHRRASMKSPDGWDTSKGEGGHGSIHRQGREKGVTPKSAPAGSGIKANESFHAATWDLVENRNKRSVWTVPTAPFSEAHFATFPPALIEPCILAGSPQGGVVLDPFGGAGTTGLVADRHGREAILIELNQAYADMAQRRIAGDSPLFSDVTNEGEPSIQALP